ncbi:MAG: CopD family protein [Methylacidiphilales bacterium]|nr:CopD family protein [Candidatus Methylacidiphilales bacterium]
MIYLSCKALHLIGAISWYGCLFYLPRLFVYHAMTTDVISKERFIIMEHKLYSYIGTPSMIVTVIAGMGMIYFNPAILSGWLWLKLFVVVGLIIFHYVCYLHMKSFKNNANNKSHVFFRLFNEVPTLALLIIVPLAVFR